MSKFTKKHYEEMARMYKYLIANVDKYKHPNKDYQRGHYDGIELSIKCIIDVFQGDSVKFNKAKFEKVVYSLVNKI